MSENEITISCPSCGATQKLNLDTLRTRGVEPLNSKRQIRKFLRRKQEGECIVPGCTEKRPLHLHRCLPGRKGGEYKVENCLLTCQKHHNMLEGCFTKEAAITQARFIEELEQEIDRLDSEFKIAIAN